jgi:hypothetical protein
MDTSSSTPYKLLLTLGEDRKRKLRQAGAKRTLVAPGQRNDMTAIILEAVDTYLETFDETHEAGQAGKPITFKPTPEVHQFIKRARNNSGMSTDQVLNALIMTAVAEGAGA